MPNNCLPVLYKYIIQVENKNMGLKGGGGTNIPLPPPPPPPNQKSIRQCFIYLPSWDIFCFDCCSTKQGRRVGGGGGGGGGVCHCNCFQYVQV